MVNDHDYAIGRLQIPPLLLYLQHKLLLNRGGVTVRPASAHPIANYILLSRKKTPYIIPLNLREDISPVSEMNYCNKLSNQRHSSPATRRPNYHNHSAKHTA